MGAKSKPVRNKSGPTAGGAGGRKRVAGALPESGAYYQALLENMADAVFVSQGVITWCNNKVKEVLGYTPDELIGRDAGFLLSQDVAPSEFVETVHDGTATRGSFHSTTRARKKDGTTIDVEFSVSRIPGKEPPELLTVCRDITQLKELEHERAKAAATAAVTDAMRDGLILIDTSGGITSVNPAFEKLTGHKKRDLVGQKAPDLVRELVSPEDWKKADRVLEKVRKGKDPAPTTAVVVTKDGRQVPVALTASFIRDSKGKPTTLVLTLKDITELKSTEDALRESEEYYRALTENALDVIMILNSDGSIRYQSPSIHNITGYPAEEREGKSVFELIHPDDLPAMANAFSQMMQNQVTGIHTELRIQHKDGSWRYLEAIGKNLLDDPKINGIVSNFRDITERKLAEEKLQRSEARFRAITEDSFDGITIISTGGNILYESPAVKRMLGSTSDGMAEGAPFTRVHPDDIAAAMNAFSDITSKPDAAVSMTLRIRHEDGSWRWIDCAGRNLIDSPSVGGILVHYHDVTERRQAEEELRERQEYFQALIENSMDGIAILNGDGTIRYESPSVERVLGFKPEELVGGRALDSVHPDDVQKVVDAMEVATKSTSKDALVEVRFLHKDGSWPVVEAVVNNLLDDPRIGGIVVNYRDITERKWAEEELRLKENALENSINAVAMSDMAGNITYVNKACIRMWGNDRKEDIIGKPYWILLNPSDAEVATEIATSMVEKGSWEGELGATIPDGSEMYVQVAAGLIKDDQGNPIQTVSSFIDITERKKAEQALKESEEKFRRFVEKMNDGYCVLQGFEVVFANARSAEMFGYTQEDVIGKTIHELLPPETVQELVDVYARRKRGEKVPAQYETTLTKKDGTECPVEFSARIIEYEGELAVSIVVRDVTERKRMEKALRESEAQFRTMFEEAAIGIALVDLAGIPIKVNPALQRMFGYTKDELSSIALTDYIHPSDSQADATIFQEIMAGERDHYTVEKRFARKDGRSIWGRQTVSPVKDREGNPLFAIAMIEDITERKTAEEERERMEQQIQLSGRLAAVGELAAGVAHELNNPLAAVQAYAQFLTSKKDLDEAIRSDVETIYKEAQRASRITGNLLSFARRHKPEKTLVSVNDIIEKSLELHAYHMKVNNIEVEMRLYPNLPMTMADFHQLQQVFVNLITNAEQAMTDTHGQGKLRIETRKAGDMIQATFTDDGPGVPEEDLARIFDPFFTTKDVGKGTGLGLSICFGIVQEHNGQLYATSKLGEGTTFVLQLPIVSEARPDPGQADLVQVEGD